MPHRNISLRAVRGALQEVVAPIKEALDRETKDTRERLDVLLGEVKDASRRIDNIKEEANGVKKELASIRLVGAISLVLLVVISGLSILSTAEVRANSDKIDEIGSIIRDQDKRVAHIQEDVAKKRAYHQQSKHRSRERYRKVVCDEMGIRIKHWHWYCD